MDMQAQIAEKKRKVEELRRNKANLSLTQNDPIIKQITEIKKYPGLESISPEKDLSSDSQQDQKRVTIIYELKQAAQPMNMLNLYYEQKKKKLGYCQVDIFSNQPGYSEEKTTYEFGVQCEIQPINNLQDSRISDQPGDNIDESLPSQQMQRRVSIKRKPEQGGAQAEKQQQERNSVQREDKKIMSYEEINSIVKSQTFQTFFDKTAKMVEKALDVQTVDILESLMAADTIQREDEMKDILSHQVSFFDQQYSINRVVTALQWSPILPDTFLTAYSQNEEGSINEQVGVVLIWSTQLKNRPEFYCFSQSPVTTAVFHPFSPSVILGGLYNGQLVLWDLRSKQTPEKRTTLSSGGHSYPIYNISVVGSQNAHNVVTASNDGKVCLWNLSMLNQPQKVVDLKLKPSQPTEKAAEINVTSMVFPKDDANNFYVGSEEGTIYHSQLHPNQTQQEGQYQAFSNHEAPITSLSLNNSSQNFSPLFQNLLLSSSFDWTVKLWNPRSVNKETPLMTFESAEDYIYDVAWNGNHPTLFSTVDGEGYVDLWDISADQEAPINRFKTGPNSINKQCWSNDGHKLATGDSQGNVQIFSLDKRALKVDQEKLSQFEASIRSSR